MIAWKVVQRSIDNNYASVIATGYALTFYELNKPVEVPNWLESRNLYPHLFDNIDSALNGLPLLCPYWNNGVFILKCKCRDEVPVQMCAIGPLCNGRIIKTSNNVMNGAISYKTIIPIEVFSVEEAALQNGFNTEFNTMAKIRSSHSALTIITQNDESKDTLIKRYLSNGKVAIVYNE